MRRLLPDPTEEFDPGELIADAGRTPQTDRPWVMANMVMSADGAYAVDGRSGPLASPADRRIFHALRAAPDAILVAAGTARAERYRRPATPEEHREARRRTGRDAPPRLVVVSRSADVPEDQPFLRGHGPEPLLLHPRGADLRGLPEGVEPRAVGDEGVDLAAALRTLREGGTEVVLCEGGPSLLGQLHARDLLDELFLTLSPVLAGGQHLGLLGAAAQQPRELHLHRVLEEQGSLFLTYRRAATPPA